MLRLIGLVVVVLLVLSVTHGERRAADGGRFDAPLGDVPDRLFGMLAAGAERLDDLVFGTPDRARDQPDLAGLAHQMESWSRNADAASRKSLAGMVLRACPSLNLVCQPAGDVPEHDEARQRRFDGR